MKIKWLFLPLENSRRFSRTTGGTEKTVHNDAKFNQAVDKLGDLLVEDTKYDIQSGESKVSKKDIEVVVEITEENHYKSA